MNTDQNKMPNHAMHPDLLQRAGSMKGKWVALRKPVMAAVGLRSDFSKYFFRGFRQAVVFENQSRCLRDGKQVVLRPTAALRCAQSGKPDAVALWCGQQFAPPNNGMHRTHPARFIGLKADCVVLASPVMPAVGLFLRTPIEE